VGDPGAAQPCPVAGGDRRGQGLGKDSVSYDVDEVLVEPEGDLAAGQFRADLDLVPGQAGVPVGVDGPADLDHGAGGQGASAGGRAVRAAARPGRPPVADTGFRRKKYAVYVWRSVREDGDTKTEKSRRTREIPDDVAKALKEHHAQQAKQKLAAGEASQDNDLVFCTSVGTPLDAANVRRSFRRITKAAGIGEKLDPEGTTPLVRLDNER
jgi:hypothetical protein